MASSFGLIATCVAGGYAAKITTAAGGEAQVLLRRADGWMAGLGDKAPVPMGDGGCLLVAATGILHKVGFAEANNGMPDRAAWLACGAVNEASRVTLPSDLTNCTVGKGDFHASAAAATSGLLDSA